MIYEVKTESGSVYRIDTGDKTWERTGVTARSGSLLTIAGTYMFCEDAYRGSKGMKITCPPVSPSTSFRFIYTSPVVEVKVCSN